MNKYPALTNLLISVMSVDVGLSEEQEEAALAASLAKKEYRDTLYQELMAAFADRELSWVSLLDNSNYCVAPMDSEREAMEYIKERLWSRIVSMDL